MGRFGQGLLATVGLLILAACLWPALAPARAQSAPTWGLVDAVLSPDIKLTTVFLIDGIDTAWVGGSVGQGGVVFRLQRQDGRWAMGPVQTFRAPIRALAAVSDDNVWAVGDAGLIAHRGAAGWTEVPNPATGANLTTIQMFGQGEAGWAGGWLTSATTKTRMPVLLHYENGQWHQDQSTDQYGTVNSLHFVAGSGWVVGGSFNGVPVLLRYTTSGWHQETILPAGGCLGYYTSLTAVRALSQDEAWAVGYTECPSINLNEPYLQIAHRMGGIWQQVPGWVDDPDKASRLQTSLNGLSFSNGDNGITVGGQRDDIFRAPDRPLVLSYRPDGQWHYEPLPFVIGQLNAVSQADATHALAVGDGGLILAYGYGAPPPAPWPTATPVPPVPPGPTPTTTPVWPPSARVPDPHLPNVLYFAVVGHSLQGGFRAYWEAHGGLAQFGYPLTEEFEEISPGTLAPLYKTQYFERARFEWHPENRSPYDILLTLLGRVVTAGRASEPAFQRTAASGVPGSRYFAPTGHNLAPEFAAYWDTHGGLPIYGYPISEAFPETSPTDGKPYLVQYFERNRLEYHPELPAPFRVSLGLLGAELLRERGWLP